MKNQILIIPEDGWEASTYYVVEIAMFMHNSIHMDIFYSGFISNDGKPAGYNKLLTAGVEIHEVKYLKVIRKIDSEIENNHKMVKEVCPEYLLIQNS